MVSGRSSCCPCYNSTDEYNEISNERDGDNLDQVQADLNSHWATAVSVTNYLTVGFVGIAIGVGTNTAHTLFRACEYQNTTDGGSAFVCSRSSIKDTMFSMGGGSLIVLAPVTYGSVRVLYAAYKCISRG